MAQTAVDIVVKVVGDQKLKQLDTSLRGTAANSVKAATGLDRSAKSARNLGNQARRAEPAVNKLGGAIRGLVTAAAVLGTAKFVIGKTAELETQTRSLQVLTGELETAEQIIGRLQKFAAITPFTSSELIETSKRLAAFGVDTDKLVETTKRLADVSGATGAALDGVATAYGQIVAKGRLQGEELLQLQERGIGIQEELQRMYGLSGEEFRKALEKGQISAEAVELAIKRLTEAGGKYADGAISQSDTLAGKFSTLQDGIENLARTIGSVLSPAIKFILDQAIQAINMINKLIGIGQKAQKFGLDQAAQKGILDQARREAEEIVNLRNIQDPFERNKVFQEVSAQRESDLLDAYGFKTGKLQVEIEPVIADNKIPELLQQNTKIGGGSSGGGSGAKASTKAADEMERQLKAGEDLSRQFSRQIKLLQTKGKYDKELLRNQFELEDAIRRINETAAPLQREGLIGEAAMAKDLQDVQTLEEAIEGLAGDVATDYSNALKESNKELTAAQELAKGTYDIISGELTNSIGGLIDGTKKWGDVLSDIAGQLGKMFLNAGFNGLGSVLGFAEGGRPPTGEVSIVGEKGPELFIPDSAGTVLSNQDSKAALSNYSRMSPGEQKAADKGEDPMSSGVPAAMQPIRMDTRVINGVEYATVEQMQQASRQAAAEGAKQGAKIGEAQTLRRLRMNPSVRRQVGV